MDQQSGQGRGDGELGGGGGEYGHRSAADVLAIAITAPGASTDGAGAGGDDLALELHAAIMAQLGGLSSLFYFYFRKGRMEAIMGPWRFGCIGA